MPINFSFPDKLLFSLCPWNWMCNEVTLSSSSDSFSTNSVINFCLRSDLWSVFKSWGWRMANIWNKYFENIWAQGFGEKSYQDFSTLCGSNSKLFPISSLRDEVKRLKACVSNKILKFFGKFFHLEFKESFLNNEFWEFLTLKKYWFTFSETIGKLSGPTTAVLPVL